MTIDGNDLVVGFDLDMTLIDTVPGFADTLRALSAELAIALPIEDLTAALGPPLDMTLRPHLAEEAINPAIDRFRELYPLHAIHSVPAFPGAHEAIAAVRRHGGRVVVVSGKFLPNVQRHIDHIGFDVDHVAGEVWGVGKAAVLKAQGAQIYVGDHIHDVEGALAAGITSVSVLSGGCSRADLEAAGTHVVLDSLLDFPDWLAGALSR